MIKYPIELKVLTKNLQNLKDAIKHYNVDCSTMLFLSENCYSWLKNNSIYIEQPTAKVFLQHDTKTNSKAYIETINIDSSNCSFLKKIDSDDYNYEYTNGIPQKIVIIILEDEQEYFNNDISASVIVSNSSENPVNCIINQPPLFKDAIVFLTSYSYQALKKNTNIISNTHNYERFTWHVDDGYPGGNILLHCLNYGSLYIICNMNFPFFSKDFSFNQIPKSLYFIE